jgi:apolipoprotein N-acyltransferase
MTTKNQPPNPRPEENQSASFLIWIISGFYLLAMIWFLLSAMGSYRAYPLWLVPAFVALTVAYGILMGLLWPHEKVAPQGRPDRLVR